MPGVNSSQQDVDIDLSQLFRAVWRRRLRVVLIVTAAALVAFVIAKVVSPEYRSETRVLIEPRAAAFATTSNQASAGSNDASLLDELNIASQVQILQSADLIKQVITQLKLYDLPEFEDSARSSALSGLLVTLHLKKPSSDKAPEERILDAFTERLQVYQINTSRVIGIQFTSRDPKLAESVPNAMASVYLSMQSGAKLDSNAEATRWLEPEIANLRIKVAEAEKKVADYRSANGLLQTNDTTSFSNQQLTDISTQLAQVRGEKANADARAQAVRNALASGGPTDTLNDVSGSQTMQRLKTTESSLESQISDLSTTLMDGHPRLKSLRAQLADIRSQITRETRKILTGIDNEAKIAAMREQQLLAQSKLLKADSARAGEDTVGLNALEREATAERQLLETYLARYREAASRSDKNSSPADARIVSSAVEPVDPYFPKVGPIVVIAAVAAFVLSAIVIMLMELFSGRALRPVGLPNDGARRATMFEDDGLPSATAAPLRRAVVPASLLSATRRVQAPERAAVQPETIMQPPAAAVVAEPEALPAATVEAVEDFSIPSVAEYFIDAKVPMAIAVSPDGDAGSTATVMLARTIADSGRRVVLVDMTGTACPTRLMADKPGLPGVTDLLCGEAAFADTIHPDRLSDAHLVPLGASDLASAMRGADRLSLILEALVSAYDLVLVECGAVNVDGIAKLTRSKDIEIILSMPVPDEAKFVAVMHDFQQAGYEHLVLMSGISSDGDEDRHRTAA
ncbi:GumC family protein [Rhizobium sp. L80/93]|uniref:GumC family protein n=1 Tax=unclassified Rhizobium TaxID=2613769 RepID=UPI001ADB42B8|nr:MULTISPECIES: exopolysaccharide transport family protein [unclassified Rhizobium]MBO9133163.1 exopolysaccharide transport family protein [Rhizobium sp. B209b/85]MBO9184250.1 exopolysaccharide transport family protein [Rhizobium sp. E27B/91]QXZ97633.1 exopolysaccharide transport family protein [Rhizobium sp. B230/85]QYA00620.1 exopolysaccharide transport family protein [Rhizobium sp. B21/90]